MIERGHVIPYHMICYYIQFCFFYSPISYLQINSYMCVFTMNIKTTTISQMTFFIVALLAISFNVSTQIMHALITFYNEVGDVLITI